MFERRFVEYALDLAREKNMSQVDFAKAVWPLKSEASATTTIIALKRQNSRGKPQNLRVSDAIKMAEVVGKEFPSMSFEVWESLKLEDKQTRKTTLIQSDISPKSQTIQKASLPGIGEGLQSSLEEVQQE